MLFPMSHLWQQAAAFAARAHKNQVRKDGLTPYFSHPVRVMMTISLVFGETDEELLSAALLHDTIEDTTTDYDELMEEFGPTVADAVAAMSKDMRLIESKREKAYDEQLAKGPWQGRLIKLGDVYDNLMDTFAGKTNRDFLEKARRALKLAANEPRLKKAHDIVAALVASIEQGR